MQERGPEECIGIYSPKLVRGCGYWVWHYFGRIYPKASMNHMLSETATAAHCVSWSLEPQTSRNARAVRKAFLGVVYEEI